MGTHCWLPSTGQYFLYNIPVIVYVRYAVWDHRFSHMASVFFRHDHNQHRSLTEDFKGESIADAQ